MSKTVTIENTCPLTITISPTGVLPGQFRVNIKYSLKDSMGSELYRKEVTYFTTESGYTPILPTAMETAVDTFLASIKTELDSVEGL